MPNPKGKIPQYDAVLARRNIIKGLGSTLTLKAKDTNSLIVFDRAAGSVVTLPANAKIGTTFDFAVGVTITSNAAKIITGVATELLVGQILNCDSDSSDAVAIWKSLTATANIAISMDGSTKGGIIGDQIRLIKISTTQWLVQGVTIGTGTVATPFATS